jgi:hypothetical protein
MTDTQRLLLRLRQRALRLYELVLCGMLLGIASGVGISVASAEPDGDSVQCGNIQSSTVVISR